MIICDICGNEVTVEDSTKIGFWFSEDLNIIHHCFDCNVKVVEIQDTAHKEAHESVIKEIAEYVKQKRNENSHL